MSTHNDMVTDHKIVSVFGKLLYAIPLYTQVTLKQLNMIHKVIMTSARVCIGSYCFKKKHEIHF